MPSRASGILLHPTSLPNAFGIGDLGPAAYRWVDFLNQSQQHWWQMLPIGPTGKHHSPYDGQSAFAGNPWLLSPEKFVEQGWLRSSDLNFREFEPLEAIQFDSVLAKKRHYLKLAYSRFLNHASGKQQAQFDEFIQQEASWLQDYALFMALDGSLRRKNWTAWDEPLRTRQPDALKEARYLFQAEMRFQAFLQWQFDLQWQELKDYAQQQDVEFMGDLPFFVAHHSAEVWVNPSLFKLDAAGIPHVVAGVPADNFCAAGQSWGVPVYDWEHLKHQNFAWWVNRIQKRLTQFNQLRLDHFIGFVRIYEIPFTANQAVEGEFVESCGRPLFSALQEALGRLPFIAEDLGLCIPEVTQLRETFGLPGMHVLQFDLAACLENFQPIQRNYPTNSVLYTGTHDNDTLSGWFFNRPETEQQALWEYLSVASSQKLWPLIEYAFASASDTVIIPMQDLLHLTSSARFNLPGTTKNNWRWRMLPNAYSQDLIDKLTQLTQKTGRVKGQLP